MKRYFTISVLLFFTLFAHSAATTYYSNAITGNWSDPASWVDGAVPDGTKENIIYIVTGAKITATTALNFSKATVVYVQSGAELIINTLNVNIDALEVNKDFVLNVDTSGKLTINGDFTAAKDATLTIEGTAVVNGNVTLGQGAILNVDVSAPAGGTLNITGNLSAGTGSTLNGNGLVTVGGTATGINDGSTTQLPVKLIYFDAKYNQNNVEINWATASEINNNFFVIEYSADAQNWDVLAQVAGSGNSTEVLNYEYQHFTKDSYYYRLKQVDFDGKTETFKTVFVNTPYINEDACYQVFDIMGRYLMTGTYQEFVNKITQHGQYILKNNTDCRKIVR
jgi:hypothetical protein